MSPRRHSVPRRTTLFVALLLALTSAGAAAAQADNVAIAINTKDGTSLFSFAFKISRTMQDVVDQTNAAVAVASCNSCQTVAIALQVVLIMSDATTITPTNLAIAYNVECNFCETLASAFQFVITTGGPVHFTPEGKRELGEIRKELKALEKSGLSIEEIQARVKELARRLAQVIATQLVPAGHGKSSGPGSSPGEEPSSSAPAPSGSPEPSQSLPATTSPSPTDTVASSSSPGESTSPSPGT